MLRCVMLDFDDTLYDFSNAIKKAMFFMIMHSGLNRHNTEKFLRAVRKYNDELFFFINKKAGTEVNYYIDDNFIKSAFDYYKIFSEAMLPYSDKIVNKEVYESYFYSQCNVSTETIETLNLLKAKGILLVILSDGVLNDKLKLLRYFKIDSLFDTIITSDQIGCIKPSLKYFEIVQKRLQLHISECVYIGNHISDYLMAKQAGVKFYAFNSDDSLAYYIKRDTISSLHTFKDILTLEKFGVKNVELCR